MNGYHSFYPRIALVAPSPDDISCTRNCMLRTCPYCHSNIFSSKLWDFFLVYFAINTIGLSNVDHVMKNAMDPLVLTMTKSQCAIQEISCNIPHHIRPPNVAIYCQSGLGKWLHTTVILRVNPALADLFLITWLFISCSQRHLLCQYETNAQFLLGELEYCPWPAAYIPICLSNHNP